LALPAGLAADWGVVLGEQFEAARSGGDDLVSRTTLAPWVTLPLGEKAELSLSAGVSLYYHDKGPDCFPELFRLEAVLRPLPGLTLRLGRIDYLDPTLFTAKGRFDGLDLSWDPGVLRLRLGAWYTGLLYRDTADISVTPGDPADYGAELDWGDFADTYFAPRRALAALQVEYPGFALQRGTLFAGILGQYDLSDAPDLLHAGYLLLRYALSLPGGFNLGAAGAASLRTPGTGREGRAAFAASLDGGWLIPGGPADRVSLGLRWASGEGSGTAAFFPVTAEAQGAVLTQGFSGIMALSGGYEARLFSGLSAEAEARYFLRTDSSTFYDPHLEGDSRLLGLELSGALRWAPVSDLSFSLGGGVFLPRTGRAFAEDAPVYRRLTAGVIFSL
jgi:hypothetical protein